MVRRVVTRDGGYRRGRRRLVRWLLATVVGLAVLAGLVTVRMQGIADDLRVARDLIRSAGAHVEAGEVAVATAELDRAAALLLSARNRLHSSPELGVVAAVPVGRDNVEALREMTAIAYQLVVGGSSLLRLSEPLQDDEGRLEVPLVDGAVPLDTVAEAARQVRDLAAALPFTAELSRDRLVGPVDRLRRDLLAEASMRRDQLDDLGFGLTLLAEMAGAAGDRRYLLAVANTAEMRGTGGMILSYGVLESAGGRLSLPAFGGIDELFLSAGVDPVGLGVDASELRRWEGLEITRLWRNVNVSPDYQDVAPRMAAMYEAATGLPVDGVIQIDASGLAAVLAGIGPVTVDGVGQVDASNVVDLTLNRAYTLFPDRDQRQEVLGDVAEVVFDRLVDGEYETLRPLAAALATAAAERHVAVWTRQSAAADALAFFDAGGPSISAESGDALLLSVQNFSRNKLDYYVDTAVSVRGQRQAGVAGHLTVEVTVANAAPVGVTDPAYVFGDGAAGPPGTYRGVASLYVPAGTALVSSRGPAAPALVGEGGRSVVTWDVALSAGSSRTVVLELELAPRPPGPYSLTLEPVARVRPTVFAVEVDSDGRALRFDGPVVRRTVVGAAAEDS